MFSSATPIYTPIADIIVDTFESPNTITTLSSVKPVLEVKYLEK
jgi:hypothetical protein